MVEFVVGLCAMGVTGVVIKGVGVLGWSRKVLTSRFVKEVDLVLSENGKTVSSNRACRETYIREVRGSRHR
jgi:hypothetical protein